MIRCRDDKPVDLNALLYRCYRCVYLIYGISCVRSYDSISSLRAFPLLQTITYGRSITYSWLSGCVAQFDFDIWWMQSRNVLLYIRTYRLFLARVAMSF